MIIRPALAAALTVLAGVSPALAQNPAPAAGPSAIPYKMIHEGRTAVDVARQICVVRVNCAEHMSNGPGPGQTTLQRALDVSTARYVSEPGGSLWAPRSNFARAAVIRVNEIGGVAHHFIVNDADGFSFPGPWIHAFDTLVPLASQP